MDPLVFPVGTRVRLLRSVREASAGSEGIVIGYYRREPPEYAVTLCGTPVAIPPECLEAIADETD